MKDNVNWFCLFFVRIGTLCCNSLGELKVSAFFYARVVWIIESSM